MATTTYEPLATVTVSSAGTSFLVMSSIPSTYTDLRLVIVGNTNNPTNAVIQFNSDTGSNYSMTYVSGDGSSASSSRRTNSNYAWSGYNGYMNSSSISMGIMDIMNYSNTTTYKSILSRYSNAATGTDAVINLWRSTSAINRIDILTGSANTFSAGTTFTLYGIANANIGAPKAQGGVITYDNTYYYHTFGASGTFTPQQSLTADVLVVAGGGGGAGSGGGAGGLLGFASQSLNATGYTVTVGAGGAGAANGQANNGTNGQDSQFGALTLVKGGAGGVFTGANLNNGLTGGSGSGGTAGGGSGSGVATGGSPQSGQGFAGGNSYTFASSTSSSGGGGGAGGAGGNALSSNSAGIGGIGLSTYSSYGLATGTGENVNGTVYYAGGGAGGYYVNGSAVAGGAGGGGLGSSNNAAGSSGKPNSGGGGGGYYSESYKTAVYNGGSGVVIIRYPKA